MWLSLLVLTLLSTLTLYGGSPLQVVNVDGTSVSDRKLVAFVATSVPADKPVRLIDILDCTGSNGCSFVDQLLGTSFDTNIGNV